jgi:hypothetical protein
MISDAAVLALLWMNLISKSAMAQAWGEYSCSFISVMIVTF